MIAIAVADEHTSSLLQQSDQPRREWEVGDQRGPARSARTTGLDCGGRLLAAGCGTPSTVFIAMLAARSWAVTATRVDEIGATLLTFKCQHRGPLWRERFRKSNGASQSPEDICQHRKPTTRLNGRFSDRTAPMNRQAGCEEGLTSLAIARQIAFFKRPQRCNRRHGGGRFKHPPCHPPVESRRLPWLVTG